MLARSLPGLVLCCVVGCGSKSAAPPTVPAESTANAEAVAGLDLACEAPNVTFTVSGATLSPSNRPNHKTDGRWSMMAGTFKLVAGETQHEGDYVGYRDTDYAFFMSQAKTKTDDEVPLVRLNGGGADGASFSLEWTTNASSQSSTAVACTGSLLTAKAPAPSAP